MIKLKKEFGNNYVMVVELDPVNFGLKTPEEKLEIISGMYSWLKGAAPKSMQFKMTSDVTDASRLIESILERTKDEKNLLTLKRRDKYIEKIKKFAASETISRRFYIIYSYEGDISTSKVSNNVEDIVETMYTIRSEIVAYFNRIGNTIVNYEDFAEANLALAKLLYKHFNPKSSKIEPFEKRYQRICSDYMTVNMLNPDFDIDSIDIDNFIAPRGFNRENPEYVVCDGKYYGFMYIKSDGYRNKVYSEWVMNNFSLEREGTAVDIYAVKKDRFRSIENAGRVVRWKRSEMNDRTRSDEGVEERYIAQENANFVRREMRENNEDMYDVFIMMTFQADTPRELNSIMQEMKRNCMSKDFFVSDCKYHNEEAFMMSLPLKMIDKRLFEKGRRNMLTSSLASTYFFTAYELFNPRGYFIGKQPNESIVVVDPFDTQKYPNGNGVICGSPGKGKTYTLLQLGYSFRASGIPVYYIIPHKGFEYYKACKEIGGQYISLAPNSPNCINIMAIRPRKKFDTTMNMDVEEEESLVAKKIHQVITFIQLLMPKREMTDAEESKLSTLLVHLYEDFGITSDNESIWIDKEKRILKTMPIIEDLYKRCIKDELLGENIGIALLPFVEGFPLDSVARCTV